MVQLLTTKLHIPALQSDLVPRPRLTQKLMEGMGKRLTLISAPAGFGKTTMLGEWHASPQGNSIPLAWLSLEREENQPVRFLAYLIAAIDSIQAGLVQEAGFLLNSNQPVDCAAVLTALLDEIYTYPRPFALVLDDYHNLTSETIHRAVEFLINHLPPNMHLIIVSRMDPPLPLARWRVRDELVEIRTDDLRFTHEECIAYLDHNLVTALSGEAITTLETRTEGWITGLKLAALSLRNDHHTDLPDFISQLNGTHRLIADYLIEEVLNSQPEEMRLFLLQTSVLTCLCGSLCNAVTGRHDGQAMLEQLERENLFIVQIDEQRTWYRYHHLFADLLRQKLEQLFPGQTNELRQRTAGWFLANDYQECAIEEAIDVQAFDLAAGWIAQLRTTLIDSGQRETIIHWIETIPASTLAAYPELARLHASTVLSPLTQREQDVLRRIAAGATNREIAETLVVSLGTVKKHMNNIFAKLCVRSRTQALVRARELGLL